MQRRAQALKEWGTLMFFLRLPRRRLRVTFYIPTKSGVQPLQLFEMASALIHSG